MKQSRHTNSGFTRVEAVVVVSVIAVTLLAVLPTLRKPQRQTCRIGCVNNLKQISISVRMWSQDNGDRPPSLVPASEGGAKELVERGLVAPYFQVMSNELGTPKIVACWGDQGRTAATNFGVLTETNVSFFIVPEADGTVTNLWLSGERHLAINRVALKPGSYQLPTSGRVSWVDDRDVEHNNLCYADGRVAKPTSDQLHSSATNNAPFRVLIP